MAVYYVKNGGNNSLDGLSNGNAWETISKINGFSFTAGDTIRFAEGSIWRETLTVPRSTLILNSYVTGISGNPQILGSKIATTWTNQGSNKWKSDITFTDPRVSHTADIMFMKSGVIYYGVNVANTASLTTEYNWTWSLNYIYVYSTSDPSTAYTWVEVPQRNFGIDLNGKEYLSITGIDFMYQAYSCINGAAAAKTDLIIDACNFSYIGGYIYDSAECTGYCIECCYSNLTIKNCEFHHSGRRAISLDIYGNGFTATNCIIEDNNFHDGFHTTGVDMKSGAGYTGAWNGIIIRRNRFYDPANSPFYSYGGTEHIWIEVGSGGSIQNVYIYSNIFINAPKGHACIHTQGTSSILGPSGLYIYNNTFYEHGGTTGSDTAMIWLYWALNVKIKNNIFYSTKNDTSYGALMIYCPSGVQNYAQVDADYNTYYQLNTNSKVWQVNGVSYLKSQFATMKATLGWETHGQVIDPEFVSTTDYHLNAGSPAISAGTPVGLTTDYDNQVWKNPPSIGAYEYDSPIQIINSRIHQWSTI